VAELIKETWAPALVSGLSRKDRRGCDYEAFVPDPLAGRAITLTGDTAADIADAERALVRLNSEVTSLVDSDAVARLLLRAEAVASSRIEGLEVGGRRLLKAQLTIDSPEPSADVTATEVLNNIEAMRWGIDTVSPGDEIQVEHLLVVHERLMRGTRLEQLGGHVRDAQNWIGGSSYNPCSAAFVPPPPGHLAQLLDDLCRFCNDDALPAVAQAALAHAQFETIHPFVDGNGRTGRALIHMVLRRRGLADLVLAPVSLVLATWSQDYIAGLTATRHPGPSDAPAAIDGLNRWMGLFAAALQRAVTDAESYQRRVGEIQAGWRSRLGRVRADSTTNRLIEALPGAPIVTVQSAATLLGRSGQATNEAIRRLQRAGVLTQITVGARNRAFEATELIDAFTELERQLASPEGDTRAAPPQRRVPRRPGT
jgi:Fic family protein